MQEKPYIVELNIRHYMELLKQPCDAEKRQQLLRLLARAKASLSQALAERDEGKRGAD